MTAFWKKEIEGGSAGAQEKVVQLNKMTEDGEKDKNKQMFGFNLEAGVWLIEVKSTDLSFASYMGNSVLPLVYQSTTNIFVCNSIHRRIKSSIMQFPYILDSVFWMKL